LKLYIWLVILLSRCLWRQRNSVLSTKHGVRLWRRLVTLRKLLCVVEMKCLSLSYLCSMPILKPVRRPWINIWKRKEVSFQGSSSCQIQFFLSFYPKVQTPRMSRSISVVNYLMPFQRLNSRKESPRRVAQVANKLYQFPR